VLERLDENQKKVYQQYKEIIKDEPLLAWMSDNYHLRFLAGYKWDAQVSAQGIIDSEN